jgi:uncharacterized protein YjbI with pentapeptide repeats
MSRVVVEELRADCSRCFGLCCVVPAFARSADFAIDKPAGRPCPHLAGDFQCGIHSSLRERGFPGCVAFDCFGAGQKVAQETFGGVSWRDAPETAADMFAAFEVMRPLHQWLWYLDEALAVPEAAALQAALSAARAGIEQLTHGSAATLATVDIGQHWRPVETLLRQVSEAARAGLGGADHTGASLLGASRRGADLRGASLRYAYLIGADLRGADLRRADFLGTDLRGADLREADLTGALFLTPPQLAATAHH